MSDRTNVVGWWSLPWVSLRGFASQRILRVSYVILLIVPLLSLVAIRTGSDADGYVWGAVLRQVNHVLTSPMLAAAYFANVLIAIGNFVFEWKCPSILKSAYAEPGLPTAKTGLGTEIDWKLTVLRQLRASRKDADDADAVRQMIVAALLDSESENAETDDELVRDAWRIRNQRSPGARMAVTLCLYVGLALLMLLACVRTGWVLLGLWRN